MKKTEFLDQNVLWGYLKKGITIGARTNSSQSLCLSLFLPQSL